MPYERLLILLGYFALLFMVLYRLARAEGRRAKNTTRLARWHELQDAKPQILALVDQIKAKDAELNHLHNVERIWETIRAVRPLEVNDKVTLFMINGTVVDTTVFSLYENGFWTHSCATRTFAEEGHTWMRTNAAGGAL